MKRQFLILLLLSDSVFGGFLLKRGAPGYERLKTGDIVFQDLGGAQGQAVRAATGSPFTHCGVVYEQKGRLYVLEALQPVSVVTLHDFKRRSRVFHARRLREKGRLNEENLQKAVAWARKQVGKNYDPFFRWDDETLYCSELVWKIYNRAGGVRLCDPKTFQAYFLRKPEVAALIRQRYGNIRNLPLKEPVVAPSDLAQSALLTEVPRRK